MDNLRELYQQAVLDHYRTPHNYGKLTNAEQQADGHNPLCGDRVTIYVRLSRERITAVGFTNSGCAISKASASLMTDAVKDKTVDQVQELHDRIVTLLESTIANENTLPDSLKILYGVREYPSRISCATLPWQTLLTAVANRAPVG